MSVQYTGRTWQATSWPSMAIYQRPCPTVVCMSRRRVEYQGDLVPFLASVFFGFAINILTAETKGWWGPLQPITRYPWIWVPLCLLAWAGWELRRSRGQRPRWTGPGSPYPGLAPFDADHASVFYGREEEARDLLTRLERSAPDPLQRFVMLVGPSGSGKSSLIRAGVLLQLPERWQVYGPVRLGSDPFGALAAAFHAGGDRAHVARLLRDDARRGGRPTYFLALAHPETGPALLVVDQWEDLYALCDEPERVLFLQLMAAVLRAHPDVRLLAAMRPEHHLDAACESALPAIDPIPLASLKPGQLREAIEEPARAAGVTFEDGLVNTMVIESTAHHSDALPLIGHLLQQLYDEAADNLITTAQYNAVGRVAGAIARHADRVYQGLVQITSKELVDSTLLRAVGVEGDLIVRRSVPNAGLDEYALLTLSTFCDARLMVETDRGGAL
jgi:energy-coupling factor transporter ATP-binding protein EcfA2